MSNIIFQQQLPFGKFITYDDVPSKRFLRVKQVHGDNIVTLPFTNPEIIDADGLVAPFNTPLENLCIITADCLPIAVIGRNGYAMLHAGWRGIKQKLILKDEVIALDPYHIFIGPHIQKQSYKVKDDFKTHFPNSKHFTQNGGDLLFDLAEEVKDQITQRIPNIIVETSDICTFKDQQFHSFRRNNTVKRNWNLLVTK